MRRMISIVLLTLTLTVAAAGTAQAANNCPGGSHFSGGRGGGICIDNASGDVVKRIVNGRV